MTEQANPRTWHYVMSVLVPILGLVFAIMWFGKGRPSQGAALLLTAALGFVIGTIMLEAIYSV